MNVRYIHSTPEAENHISYCARVSAPQNQENYDTASKLLGYCIKNNHWSIFEMASLCVEIETGRDVAPQILRHRSFSFQEYSQRYATADMGYQERNPRSQDKKNRQASNDDLPEDTKEWFYAAQYKVFQDSYTLYQAALKSGIAKECARSLLPLNTTTRLYMHGSIRSWITYCLVRCEKATQLEHREIANDCWKILREVVPNVCKAVEDQHEYMRSI